MSAVDITDARCEFCGSKVTAEVTFTEILGGRTILCGDIGTYWHCDNHGAVGAIIDGKYYPSPSSLFKSIRFVDWNVVIRRGEHARRPAYKKSPR